jgi:hypothetical protein
MIGSYDDYTIRNLHIMKKELVITKPLFNVRVSFNPSLFLVLDISTRILEQSMGGNRI